MEVAIGADIATISLAVGLEERLTNENAQKPVIGPTHMEEDPDEGLDDNRRRGKGERPEPSIGPANGAGNERVGSGQIPVKTPASLLGGRHGIGWRG
jgi:hypothetical protein